MDMNTATPPKKGLKTRPCSMDMEDHIVTLPKKGLKTRPYSMDMNKDIATLPKKGLKAIPYTGISIGWGAGLQSSRLVQSKSSNPLKVL